LSVPEPGHYYIRWPIEMSYIHEALKKAEEERDYGHGEYGRAPQVRRETPNILGGGSRRAGLIFLFVILLAFVSYSWWNSGSSKHPLAPEPVRHKALSQPEVDPDVDVRGIYDSARLSQESGRLDDARRLYQKALKVDPGHVEALNNLGVIYIHDRDFPAARDSFEKAIRLRPGYVDPYYNLACVYALKDEIPQSLAYLKKAGTVSKSALIWARSDADLERLRGLPEFQDVIGNIGAKGHPDEKAPDVL